MASYAYYIEDDPILSDDLYNDLCLRLLAQDLGSLQHPHLHLVDYEALRAGTAYQIAEYPPRVIGAVAALRRGV